MQGLYAIVDPEHCRHDPLYTVEAVLCGGCALLQLRVKAANDRVFMDLATQCATLCQEYQTPLVINDRVDIALAVGAAMVHLGQDDLPATKVKKIAPQLGIGLSTHNESQFAAAQSLPLAYVALGPIHTTQSKENPEPTVGLHRLRDLSAGSKHPIVAIGGLDQHSAQDAVAAGASLIASISALTHAEDPEHSARTLHQRCLNPTRHFLATTP